MSGRRWREEDDEALIAAIGRFGVYDLFALADTLKRTQNAIQQRISKGPPKLRKVVAEAARKYRILQDEIVPSPTKTAQTEIVRLREEGRSWSAIGDTLGIKRDKVRSLYQEAVGGRLPEENLEDLLRPIAKPAPPPRPCTLTPTSVDIIAGDFHWPKSDKRAEAVLLEAIGQLRPGTVYLNGDLFDMMAQSRFDKEYRKRFSWVPQDEADAGANFLYLLEQRVQEWDGKIVMTLGNHEDRWWRWLNQIAPALVAMKDAEERLAFQAWFIPKWSRLTISEDDIVIMPDSDDPLVITHGVLVRQNAGASALGMGLKLMSSVVIGHTHRLGMACRRVPARGKRAEEVIRTYELGCLADLQPPYVSKPDWQNGFGVLMRDEQAGSWALEPVAIINGRATVAALGRTIQA